MQNIPLSFDPSSKDQARINRELTEVIRQLWKRMVSVEKQLGEAIATIKKLNITKEDR
jgi:hypothetical protein